MKKAILFVLLSVFIGLSLAACDQFNSGSGCQQITDCEAFEVTFNEWVTLYGAETSKTEFGLYKGAPNRDIEALKKFSGGELHADLEWLLRLHNGSKYEYEGVVFNNQRLNTVDEIISESGFLDELNRGEAESSLALNDAVDPAGWWHPRFLLVFADQNGGGIAVDRRTGEVWNWDHDGGLWGLRAPNLTTFFEWINLAIKNDNFVLHDQELMFFELDPSKADESEDQKHYFEEYLKELKKKS